jgi:hypothetical protein
LLPTVIPTKKVVPITNRFQIRLELQKVKPILDYQDLTIEEVVAAQGSQVKFPPGQPDLNPIGKMWSKFKQCLRGMKVIGYASLLR